MPSGDSGHEERSATDGLEEKKKGGKEQQKVHYTALTRKPPPVSLIDPAQSKRKGIGNFFRIPKAERKDNRTLPREVLEEQ